MIQASCLCGAVRWEVDEPLELMSHCHCSICRKTHGTAYGTYVAAREGGFRWVKGEDTIRHYASSAELTRAFCGTCGCAVPASAPEGQPVFMPAGPLDGDPGTRPQAHIFAASRAPWFELGDELPAFDAYPPGWSVPDLDADPRPRSDDETTRGSCQCNAVAWEVEGHLEFIRFCHCMRCRKARGAAFATNAFIGTERFRFVRGEDQLETYKLPDAARFSQAFCQTCGSPMPRVYPEPGMAVIPAGSIDGDPGGRPSAHIFVASMAPWDHIDDDLPRFDESQPRSG